MCPFIQLLRTSWMWHKVIFWAELNRFEFSFPSPRLVAILSLPYLSVAGGSWMYTFPKGINAMQNANSPVQVVAVSIYFDGGHYTMSTPIYIYIYICVGFKIFIVGVHQCGIWKVFYGSQWLRARLCCRKISDSIFWLFCFTPRWLGRCNALPKKVHKKYTKRER